MQLNAQQRIALAYGDHAMQRELLADQLLAAQAEIANLKSQIDTLTKERETTR